MNDIHLALDILVWKDIFGAWAVVTVRQFLKSILHLEMWLVGLLLVNLRMGKGFIKSRVLNLQGLTSTYICECAQACVLSVCMPVGKKSQLENVEQ